MKFVYFIIICQKPCEITVGLACTQNWIKTGDFIFLFSTNLESKNLSKMKWWAETPIHNKKCKRWVSEATGRWPHNQEQNFSHVWVLTAWWDPNVTENIFFSSPAVKPQVCESRAALLWGRTWGSTQSVAGRTAPHMFFSHQRLSHGKICLWQSW